MAGDPRAGLDEQTLTELRRIMERERVNFDEARRLHMERMFRKAGIGPDGLPIGEFPIAPSLSSRVSRAVDSFPTVSPAVRAYRADKKAITSLS